ncbi:MAG: gliding motility-associated C-terminal domain-containing protein [Flavobacteriales bacterium]|nr:gliding motility-associated C-terminal domain-containing protein [Flavobacteriales bacterium]
MVIYNRWGQVVYETIEPNKPWQGDCEGTPSPDRTYFYIIRWENECGGIPGEHFGHVTLLR